MEEIQKILTQKGLEQKIIDWLCNQNVLFVKLKVKICEAKGLLSNLEIETPLSKIPILNVLL